MAPTSPAPASAVDDADIGHERVPPDHRAFPVQEYRDRIAHVQRVMGERSLSALLVVDPANLYYLTGYNAWSFYTPQALVVPAAGMPHLFSRTMDAQGAGWTTWLPDEHIHGYPEDLVHRPDTHPFVWITDRAIELGVLPDTGDSTIAAELDAHYFSPRGFLALHARLDQAALVDSGELVNWVRLIKSPAEQEKLRVAGHVATQVMTVAIEGIREGRRQCDVVAEIQHAQALGSAKLGGDYPAIVPMLPTGISASAPHLTWSDAELVPGEATTIEIAGVHHRYHAPLARTVALGRPTRELVHCADAVTEAMQAALERMRPGVESRAVHEAFTTVIHRHGLTKESRIGYSIGIGYPPDWGERTVSLRARDTTVLAPGMAFHVMLGMWMDGWGYELSEPVLITQGGHERLTDLPQELTVRP